MTKREKQKQAVQMKRKQTTKDGPKKYRWCRIDKLVEKN
jgi:hypothetical protein